MIEELGLWAKSRRDGHFSTTLGEIRRLSMWNWITHQQLRDMNWYFVVRSRFWDWNVRDNAHHYPDTCPNEGAD